MQFIRPFQPIALALIAFIVNGCGSGSSDPAFIAFTPNQTQAVAQQIVIATSSTPFMNSGATYTLRWQGSSSSESHVSNGLSITPIQIAFTCPNLTLGEYSVDVALGSETGRFAIELTAAPPIGDPVAYVANYQHEFDQILITLDAVAQAEPDPVLRASMLADNAAIARYHHDFGSALTAATSAEINALAQFLNANDFPATFSSVLPAPLQESFVIAVAAYSGGILFCGMGIYLVKGAHLILNPLVQLAQYAAGGVLLGTGFQLIRTGQKMRFLPRGDLDVSPITRTVHEQLGNTLSLSSGVPMPLEAKAEFATLSAVDREHQNEVVRRICAAIDFLQISVDVIFASLRSYISTAAPALPEQPTIKESDISMLAIEIASQSNYLVYLELSNGALTAEVPYGVEDSTQAIFRHSIDQLGAITASKNIEVVNECNPSVPLTGTFITPGQFGTHQVISFENEAEPLMEPFAQLRLGDASVNGFYVDLNCRDDFGLPTPGFWLLETSGNGACYPTSPPNVGQAIYDIRRISLTPSTLIRSFGGYFSDSTFIGSSWEIIAVDCLGRSWSANLPSPYCVCGSPPFCGEVTRWTGFRFSQPIIRIDLRISSVGTYRWLVMDDLTWESW